MKEFIPYQEALALKELGFDEPCFGFYNNHEPKRGPRGLVISGYQDHNEETEGDDLICSAPTYSQAFRFFREKYGLHQYIKQYYGEKFYFQIEDMVHPRRWDEYTVEMLRSFNESTSQEESELACLKKLIEIVKNKEK